MTRPLSPRHLREAAEVASETGCGVVIERGPDGTLVYKLMPPGQSFAITATEKDQQACDAAFGVSG